MRLLVQLHACVMPVRLFAAAKHSKEKTPRQLPQRKPMLRFPPFWKESYPRAHH